MTTATISSLPADLQAQAEVFKERFGPGMKRLRAGKPDAMMEGFLSILDKKSQMIVDFVPNNNQRYVHSLVFEPLKSWRDPVEAVIVKDRQATMTSFFQGAIFEFVVTLPNNHAFHVFQDDKTGEELMKRLDMFQGRLNPFCLNHDGFRIKKISDSKTELQLQFWDGETLIGTSSYQIVSAGSREFGAGPAPNIVIYDEYDLYPNLDLVSRIDGGLGGNAKVFKISTPRGMKQLYTDYHAAKEGRTGAIAIFLPCFQNPENTLERGHSKASQQFREDFEYLPEHLRILESDEWKERSVFTTDEEAHGFFRWWEWKRQEIRNRLEAEGIRDEKRVLGEMEAEHCTNDRDCWLNIGKTPFDFQVLQDYTKFAKQKTVRRDQNIAPGLRLLVYEPPQPGMVYACGMDCAEGAKTGDAIAAYIKDAQGNYVASLYGRCDLAVATRAVVQVCEAYNNALFAPEVDGGLGFFVIEEARRNGYTNFWKVPIKQGENADRYVQKPDRYGWKTQNNKEEMKQRGVARFNNRDCLVWDDGLLRSMANFDPETQKHTDDRLMAYFITEAITDQHHPKGYGRQFWHQAANVKGLAAAPIASIAKRRSDPVRAQSSAVGVWGRR